VADWGRAKNAIPPSNTIDFLRSEKAGYNSGDFDYSIDVSRQLLRSSDSYYTQENPFWVGKGQLTFNAEGNDIPTSPFYSRNLHWPGGDSGVTLGRGYDMKFRTENRVVNDLVSAGLDQDAARDFAQGAGLSGQEAKVFVTNNRITLGAIDPSVQKALFQNIYPQYEATAERVYNKATSNEGNATPWMDLKPALRDVAVDLVYQGLTPALGKPVMQKIMTNDIDAVIQHIQSTPAFNQYEQGRGRIHYLDKNR
jgi:hypothetical protein